MSLLIVFGLIQYVQTYVNDPLEKLKNKRAKKNHPKFELKNVNQKMVEKALTKMKKKSAGVDGLGQDQLVMGSPIVSMALTSIFNKSLNEGQFPQAWKEALFTPVLKKGDAKMKENMSP